MRRTSFKPADPDQLRITRVALVLLFALMGLSLVFGMSDEAGQRRMAEWLVPTPDSVWHQGKVWTLVTGPFLEPRIVSLLFEGLMLWMLLPRLERWWGPRRFLMFVAMTAIAASIAGTLTGLALGRPDAIVGFNPTILAGTIAFGVLYARQPVQFFGVLPMTGRAFMWGMIVLTALFVLIGQEWSEGAAMAAAMAVGAGLASGRIDPIAVWRRRRYAKARSHLSVVPPDVSTMPRRPKGDERYLN
ncbi:MAG: rhomboid family intramembrane serine protease [Myxococcales bacterium]|nr:rhomboid family intramembrane serine protease [Myxococcales bacterium]